MPFLDVALTQQKIQETSFMRREQEFGFVEPLNRIINVAASKLHVHALIRQIQHGGYRLRISLNKLPSNFPVADEKKEEKIALIKIFM